MLTWKRAAIAAIAAWILFEAAYDGFSYARCLPKCYPHDQHWNADNGEDSCSLFGIFKAGPSVFALSTAVRFVHRNRSDINAWSTLAIGFFTGLLFIVTGSQLGLVRDEFLATHRPKITVRRFNTLTEGPTDEKVSVEFLYVNTGSSDATVMEIGAKVENRMPPSGIIFARSKIVGVILASGDREIFHVQDAKLFYSRLFKQVSGGKDGLDPHIAGYVRYADAKGRIRETGFCRRFHYGTQSWVKVKDSEYEYQD